MSKIPGIVSKILTFSCVDGPGSRLVVFLQGCNFNCSTCHNPHTIGECNHCGDCVGACPVGALQMKQGRVVWQAEMCTECDDCLAACPIDANPKVQPYQVSQLLSLIHQHKPFLNGITISGGEPTLQLSFVETLFRAIKADPLLAHLTTMVDSNGHLGEEEWQRLLPVLDGAMIDLKAWTNKTHLRVTSQDRDRVLNSIRLLHRHDRLYEVRYLVIPGVTDQPSQVKGSAEFLIALDANIRVRLNAYQHHGVRSEALQWPRCDEAQLTTVATQFQQLGLTQLIKPTVYL